MDSPAISALPPAGAAASQTADAGAKTADGKTFVDALAGVVNRQGGKEGRQAPGKPDLPADAQSETAVQGGDPSAVSPLLTAALDPGVASLSADTSGQATFSPALSGQTGLANGPELAADDAGIIGRAGMLQANVADPRLAVATHPAATHPAEAGESSVLSRHEGKSLPAGAGMASRESKPASEIVPGEKLSPPNMAGMADPRQAEQASANNARSSFQALSAGDRLTSKETGAQAMPAQNASLPGMANQLNAAFHIGASQPAPVDAPTSALIAPHVGAPGWSEAMGQRMVMMASDRIQHAELRLNPEGLGPLQVVLSLDQGAADVQFLAHDAQVREALQSALPKLQEMLASAGFSLDKVSVDSGSARNHGNHGNAEQFSQPRRESGQGTAEDRSLPASRLVANMRPGRIDTFA
jgi:flagellar hook-length control protein FliK